MAIEKKYLTFDELLVRWDCEKKDIHYMIMESELIPSIFWNDHVYLMQWQPNPKVFGELLLSNTYDDFNDIEYESRHETFHLKLPTKTGVLKYYFRYGTLGLYDAADEFGKTWYKLAEFSSHSQAGAMINQEDIEYRCVFMIDDIDFREALGEIPARLNKVVVNEKPKQLQEVEKPIHPRTENNYLSLILTLCSSIEGFDAKKPYEAATLIIDTTGTKLNKQTIADYITKAYAIECEKRD
jgi:hypothetical protein